MIRRKIPIILVGMSIFLAALLVSPMSIGNVSGAQLNKNVNVDSDVDVVNLSLNNADAGVFNIGDKFIFNVNADVKINGIYKSKDEAKQDEYSVVVKKGEVWNTSALSNFEGMYIAYTAKNYAWIHLTHPLSGTETITLSNVECATAGGKITISGTSNIPYASKFIVKVDGEEVGTIRYLPSSEAETEKGGEFSFTAETSGMISGMHEVGVYYSRNTNVFDMQTFYLYAPKLAFNVLDADVTPNGIISISGDATGGTDTVRVWVIGDNIAGTTIVPVDNSGHFAKELNCMNMTWVLSTGQKKELDSFPVGVYTLMVVHPEGDGFFQMAGGINDTGQTMARSPQRFFMHLDMSNNNDIVLIKLINVRLPSSGISSDMLSVEKGEVLDINIDTTVEDGRLFILESTIGSGGEIEDSIASRADNGVVNFQIDTEAYSLMPGIYGFTVKDEMGMLYEQGAFTIVERGKEAIMPIEEENGGVKEAGREIPEVEEEQKESKGGAMKYIFGVIGVVAGIAIGFLVFNIKRREE